jgi:hypothetical protein
MKDAHRQRADAIAIRGITHIHGERSETCALRQTWYEPNMCTPPDLVRTKHVHSARPGTNQTCALRQTWYEPNHHQVLRGASVETVSILVQYRVIFSTALVPQLQLWHFNCTNSYSNARSAFTSAVGVHFLSRKETALTRRRQPRKQTCTPVY